jgi:hypothetical protein
MEIVDYQTGKDALVRWRFLGRLSGLTLVSLINSAALLGRKKKFCLALFLLGFSSFFSVHCWMAFKLVVPFCLCIYLPLGYWKARTYRGLKALVVDELDRMVDTKKCESGGE